jgi:hypothetical protein
MYDYIKWSWSCRAAHKIYTWSTWWRRQPSSYCYGPVVQGRLVTHHSGSDHGGVEGLRQGAGKSSWILPISRQRRLAVCFCGKEIRPLGFSCQGDFIGERALSEGGPPDLTMGWRGQGLGRAPAVVSLAPGPPRLIFGLHETSVKIEGSAFVSSNSENISCVTFLKHKISRK